MRRTLSILIVLTLINIVLSEKVQQAWAIVGNPLAFARPCKDNDDITIQYESGRPPDEENQYTLYIDEKLPAHSQINLKLDTEATVTLVDSSYARINAYADGNFNIRFYKNGPSTVTLDIKGPPGGAVPYPLSIQINTAEYCKEPQVGILDGAIVGNKGTAVSQKRPPKGPTCGRRQVEHTELITNGSPTKPGDWPWHAAIYRLDKAKISYICGGTLISKTLILTAAHCTTRRGVALIPEILHVVLGKYNLAGGDIGVQERDVHQVLVHPEHEASILAHDVALLKLQAEAAYGMYVQPACLWDAALDQHHAQEGQLGTVVGWGFDQTDHISSQLKQAVMPVINEAPCLRSNPTLFGKLLKEYNFCGGYRNGTAACNGDSGGGFTFFVQDEGGAGSGAWYVRGVVSVGASRRDVALCDPNQYVLFTSVSKHLSWIRQHMNSAE